MGVLFAGVQPDLSTNLSNPDPTWNRLGGFQCKAWSKQQKRRCRNYALPGQQICKFHGGNQASSKRKAARMLLKAVRPDMLAEIELTGADLPEPRDIWRSIKARNKRLRRVLERNGTIPSDIGQIRIVQAQTRKDLAREITKASA